LSRFIFIRIIRQIHHDNIILASIFVWKKIELDNAVKVNLPEAVEVNGFPEEGSHDEE
jgi:hypothetical protein